MTTVDLTKTEEASAEDVYNTTVALFNNPVSSPRVLAECENYLAYTLKNGHTLRLIYRSNNIKGSLKEHTKPIRAVRFVNYRSNVAASASDGEFLVWVVNNDNPPKADPSEATLTVSCYFRLTDQVTIPRFAFFINPVASGPDLLLLHDTKATILESSKLISAYNGETLTASFANNSRELRDLNKPASSESLCATNTSGWFAFNTDDTLVVACTLRNTSTPAWHACDKEVIKSLELLMYPDPASPSTLLAGSTSRVCQWRLEGDAEPVHVRTFLFGSQIETMIASHHTFAIFNSDNKVALIECAQPNDQYKAVAYHMPFEVTAGSVCFYRTTHFGCALVDRGDAIEMVQLTVRKPPAKLREERKKPAVAAAAVPAASVSKPAVAAAAAAVPAPASKATPFVDPAILTASPASPSPPPASASANQESTSKNGAGDALSNLMNQVRAANKQQQQQQQPSPKPAEVVATSALPVTAPNHSAARAALQNSALLQTRDGPLMEAAEKGDEDVEHRIASIRSVLATITDILKLTPGQATRDHEELLNLALEAQMTQLQQQGRTGATPSSAVTGNASSPASTMQHDAAFNSYALACLMAPVAREMATGITNGITHTLQTELDNAIKNAFGDSVRDSQKQILKKRLDEALEQSSRHYAEVVRQRLAEFTNNELRAAFAEVNASMSKVISDNRRLQQQLNEILNSGLLNEVAKMKTELRDLRLAAQSGTLAGDGVARAGTGANPSAFQGARPTPETILSTAKQSIEDGEIAAGLDYVVLADLPELVVTLFEQLDEDTYGRATIDKAVSDSTWIKALTLMTNPGAAQGNDAHVKVAETVFDVLSERDDLIDRSSADAKLLRSNVRHFLVRAKDRVGSRDGQETLKSLEKMIQ